MELKDLYDQLTTKREMATLDPNLVDARIRPGIEGKIRAAQSEVPELERQYKNKVANDSVIIAVKGKYCKEFASIAQTEFKTLSVDYLECIDDISESILKRGGEDRYTSKEHLMTMDELNKIKMKYGISILPVFQANYEGVGPNDNIRQALLVQFTKQYGGDLFSAVTRGKIGDGAIQMGFKGNKLPVVLFNYTVDLTEGVLSKPVDVITINEMPTKQSVGKMLVDIRDRISKPQ